MIHAYRECKTFRDPWTCCAQAAWNRCKKAAWVFGHSRTRPPDLHPPARPDFERPRAAQAPPRKAPRPSAPSGHSPPDPARIPTRPPPTSRPYPQPHQGPRPAHAAHLAHLARHPGPASRPRPRWTPAAPAADPTREPLPTFPRQRDPLTISGPRSPFHLPTRDSPPASRCSQNAPPVFRSSAAPPGYHQRTTGSAASPRRPLERPGRPAGPANGHL